MKNKIKSKIKNFVNGIVFRVIGSIIILLLVFTIICQVLGFIVFSKSIIKIYEKNAFNASEQILKIIDSDKIQKYLEKKDTDDQEYFNKLIEIFEICSKSSATRISIFSVNDKFSEYTYIFDLTSISSDSEEESLGNTHSITNERVKKTLKKIYKSKNNKEVFVNKGNAEKNNSYLITYVPILNSNKDVAAVIEVKYSINELTASGKTYFLWITIISSFFSLIVSVIVYKFFKKNIVNPIIDISNETERFANENTIKKEKLIEENSKITEIRKLATSIDKMEYDTVNYIQDITKITKEKEKEGIQLKLASQIQQNALTTTFPNEKDYSLFASMTPAKEIGGDFYDFYKIDDDHLALVIADVSGKGIPAALFMMVSKVVINTNPQNTKTPADILTSVNDYICSKNKTNMFVTVWLGILEISTGKLTFANAGHEDIAIYRKGKKFTLDKRKHGIVVGVIENYKYKNEEITLKQGDKIFLYTDGIPEAEKRNKEMFGLDRMLQSLNKAKEKNVEEILKNVKKDIKEYVGDYKQFDDITMLAFEYKKQSEKRNDTIMKKEFLAKKDELDKVTEFIHEEASKFVDMKTILKIDVVVEEIFINISNYAYPNTHDGKVEVEIKNKDNKIIISFKDNGIPFNPLEKKDPDITLSVEEREIGGLGIFMVKKMMDNVEYMYKDNKNILIIEKNIDVEV